MPSPLPQPTGPAGLAVLDGTREPVGVVGIVDRVGRGRAEIAVGDPALVERLLQLFP
jgi:hypothetical protein